MNQLTTEQTRPLDIELDLPGGELHIEWADGYHSVYPLDYLRQICPCATCVEQRKNADPLRILEDDQSVASGKLNSDRPVEMVGNYGLQFFWGEGHSSGIYSFRYLREQTP